jgi:insertion element IS1 protein InsB
MSQIARTELVPECPFFYRQRLLQKVERKHPTLRTRLKRLARTTLCFSRSHVLHDLRIGLYMSRVEFGCVV